MAQTARSLEQEVFDCERVRITIAVPQDSALAGSYRAVYPEPLADDAPLAHLQQRINTVLGTASYTVVHPLGSPTRISAANPIGRLREYYEPKACPALGLFASLRKWAREFIDALALDTTSSWQ